MVGRRLQMEGQSCYTKDRMIQQFQTYAGGLSPTPMDDAFAVSGGSPPAQASVLSNSRAPPCRRSKSFAIYF